MQYIFTVAVGRRRQIGIWPTMKNGATAKPTSPRKSCLVRQEGYARTFMTMKLTIATTMTAPRIEGMTAMPPKLGPQAPNRP